MALLAWGTLGHQPAGARSGGPSHGPQSSSGREFPLRWLMPDALSHAAGDTHPHQRVLAGSWQRTGLQEVVPVEAERGVFLLLQLLQLVQLLGAGRWRLHLKGHLKAAVVHLERALLQGHAGLEAVSPEDLVLRVGGAGLARHSCGKTTGEPCQGPTMSPLLPNKGLPALHHHPWPTGDSFDPEHLLPRCHSWAQVCPASPRPQGSHPSSP